MFISRSSKPSRLAKLNATGLLHDQRGVAAIEFGLVSLPFFGLLATIIQVAFMIWAQQNLDFALQKTVRSLFTGQFQTTNAGTTNPATLLATMKTNMCGSGGNLTPVLFDCSGLKIDVTLGTSFANITPPTPINPGTRDWAPTFGTNYSCAAPGTIVITTAAVKFPSLFNLLTARFASFSDGSALLMSTVVFRTEPYGTSSC